MSIKDKVRDSVCNSARGFVWGSVDSSTVDSAENSIQTFMNDYDY